MTGPHMINSGAPKLTRDRIGNSKKMITVLFFAQLSESAGLREVRLDDNEVPMSVRDLADKVLLELPKQLARELFDGTILVAVNKKRADWETQVCAGDEVAFLPPVSGG